MTTAKKDEAKKPAPKKVEKDDAQETEAYTRGRDARSAAIGRDQAPFGKDDPLLKHWQKGWDFEDDYRG